MVTFLGVMTSIFWGQLSLCDKIDISISHYTCNNRVLYRLVCLVGVAMHVFQVRLNYLTRYIYS